MHEERSFEVLWKVFLYRLLSVRVFLFEFRDITGASPLLAEALGRRGVGVGFTSRPSAGREHVTAAVERVPSPRLGEIRIHIVKWLLCCN